MSDLQFEILSECSDFSEYCVPPVFDLPPPPRPPWLEDIDNCSDLGLCPNDPIVSTVHDAAEGIFHSVITVVVASIAIVISIILIALFIWRHRRRVRRNLGFLSEKGVDENQPCGNQTVYHAKRLNHYSNNLLVESQEKNNFPTLIIAGVPFQVVRRESANLSDRTETTSAPIYETIEDTQYIGGVERVYAQLENLCDSKCECVPRNEKIGTINLQNSFRQVKSGQQLNPYIHSISSSNLGHEDTYSLQYSEPIGGIRPSPGHRLVQVRGDPAEVLQVYMKRRELENSSGFQSIRRGRVPGKAPTLSRFKPGSSVT